MNDLNNIEYQISALNDLIRINNDRISGYKKRIIITLDDDLEVLFSKFIYQSLHNTSELTEYIYLLGGKPADGSRLSGKFYHSWINFEPPFIKQDRQTLLDYCEYGEDVVKSAYRKVLDDKELQWDKGILKILINQFNKIQLSYDKIKWLFDRALIA
jgi:uncharacterized protein (TIGR02284 family)